MDRFTYGAILCETVKKKSTCDRSQVGAVIFDDSFEVVSTGYNGPVKGAPNCGEVGHLMVDGHCVRTVHAEINAIAQCARQGKSCKGCIMFVTYVPCENCAKLIIQAGITKVYANLIRYEEGYNLLISRNIKVYNWKGEKFNINQHKD